MSSYTEIIAFIAAVESRLSTNAAAITPTGMNPITIYERDDKPFKIADGTQELPIMYVIPLAEGQDEIQFQQGDGSLDHELSFTLMGYYEEAVSDLNSTAGQTQRRLILKAMFDTVDLFKGSSAFVSYTDSGGKVGAGYIHHATAEIGYFDDKGNVIAGCLITFNFKLMSQP